MPLAPAWLRRRRQRIDGFVHRPALLFRLPSTPVAAVVCLLLLGLVQPVRVCAAPVKLLALGDSLTAGYGLPHADGFVARLQQAVDAEKLDATILDAGVSGDTSTDALARLDWALGDDPDGVILEIGGNDGLRGLPVAPMERNIDAILDTLQRRGLPVLLSGIVAPPNMGAVYGDEFHAAFQRLLRRPGLLADPFFLQDVALHEDLEQSDHIHPNAKGVRVIVARLMPEIRRLVVEARQFQSRQLQSGKPQSGQSPPSQPCCARAQHP